MVIVTMVLHMVISILDQILFTAAGRGITQGIIEMIVTTVIDHTATDHIGTDQTAKEPAHDRSSALIIPDLPIAPINGLSLCRGTTSQTTLQSTQVQFVS